MPLGPELATHHNLKTCVWFQMFSVLVQIPETILRLMVFVLSVGCTRKFDVELSASTRGSSIIGLVESLLVLGKV